MEMNMLGWSSEAGNPNIQDLKENWQKRSGRSPLGTPVGSALIFNLQERLRKLSVTEEKNFSLDSKMISQRQLKVQQF